ncbi:MAG: hypothetical protein WAX89_04350 [Alphaproteobacteria bacterium]
MYADPIVQAKAAKAMLALGIQPQLGVSYALYAVVGSVVSIAIWRIINKAVIQQDAKARYEKGDIKAGLVLALSSLPMVGSTVAALLGTKSSTPVDAIAKQLVALAVQELQANGMIIAPREAIKPEYLGTRGNGSNPPFRHVSL